MRHMCMGCPQVTDTIQLANEVAEEVVEWCAKTEPENPTREGMCDRASEVFMDLFNQKIGYAYIRATTEHGEIIHTPRIKSEYWCMQHTWNVINISGVGKVYVDTTGPQFRDIFQDIPEIYVSTEPPKWYLPDSKNICFKPNSVWKRLNGYIIPIPTRDGIHRARMIDFLVHGIVGFLSDHLVHPFLKG